MLMCLAVNTVASLVIVVGSGLSSSTLHCHYYPAAVAGSPSVTISSAKSRTVPGAIYSQHCCACWPDNVHLRSAAQVNPLGSEQSPTVEKAIHKTPKVLQPGTFLPTEVISCQGEPQDNLNAVSYFSHNEVNTGDSYSQHALAEWLPRADAL